jgi:type II secretory pathway component PulK
MAGKDVLVKLLEDLDIPDATALAKNIYAWRGGAGVDIPKVYEAMGYSNKGEEFSNIEELNLVAGITPEIYQKLKGVLAVYMGQQANINTASLEVLNILGNAAAVSMEPNITKDMVSSVVKDIIDYRIGAQGPFDKGDEIDDFNINILTEDQERKLFTAMSSHLKAQSDYFRIEAQGHSGDVSRRITVVYQRGKNIVYWHQN